MAYGVSWKRLYIQMHDIACETAVRGGQICITLPRTLPEGALPLPARTRTYPVETRPVRSPMYAPV